MTLSHYFSSLSSTIKKIAEAAAAAAAANPSIEGNLRFVLWQYIVRNTSMRESCHLGPHIF